MNEYVWMYIQVQSCRMIISNIHIYNCALYDINIRYHQLSSQSLEVSEKMCFQVRKVIHCRMTATWSQTVMLLKVTMVFLLSLSSASLSENRTFNNTVLKYPIWPINNCTSMLATSAETCTKVTQEKTSCQICNDTGCTIHVAVLFPEDSEFILNLNRVNQIVFIILSIFDKYAWVRQIKLSTWTNMHLSSIFWRRFI